MYPADVSIWIRKRYYVAIWVLTGIMLMTLVNVNLSISIIDLTSEKTITIGNATYIQKPIFGWTPPQKGLILSTLYWGHIMAPIGAVLSNKFGGVTMFGISLLFQGLLTILSPTILRWSVPVFAFGRFMEGVLQGTLTASSYDVIVKWAPPNEFARLSTISYMGYALGAAVCYPLAGLINHLLNWECVFYFTGGIIVIWYIISYLSFKNSPGEDKLISRTEKTYLKAVCKDTLLEKVSIPWKSIFTSPPIYAYWNERFVEAWSYSFLLTCLPLYIKDVYPSNIKDIGLYSSIPHLSAISTGIAGSWLLDYLRSRIKTSKTTLHKRFIIVGQIPGACLFIALGFWKNFHWAMVIFSVFKICFSAAYASYFVLPYDMSGHHANAVVGIAMSFKAIGTMVNPIVMGIMTQNHLVEEWSRYFWFLSIFNLWGLIIFAKYGSGETQSWVQAPAPAPIKI